MLFEDAGFIRFVDSISKLNIADKIHWPRNTEVEFIYMNRHQIRELVNDFNQKYIQRNIIKGNELYLSAKWLDYLSISSKYWDTEHITELYNTIFMILTLLSQK